MKPVYRGEIYLADLSPVVGSEQGGNRPVLIIQNDIGNKFGPTVIVAAITSQISKGRQPTHVEISAKDYDIEKDSVILLEQIRTIDKQRLSRKVATLNFKTMEDVNEALEVSLSLITPQDFLAIKNKKMKTNKVGCLAI
ncbi:type II toxin-antitoxin system PemK/MazF family toxin [Brevibacillus brevis X23]|nr:type II toxin-antitoxin system PemK/MazF family toxin [Brevibacillus brevis X23]